MFATKVFIILLSFYFLNSSLSTNFTLKSSTDDENLAKSICKITNDVINSRADTQDILIGNLGGQIWSSTINDIIQCIDDRNAVVLTDFKTKITEKSLKKASVTILALQWFNNVSLKLYCLSGVARELGKRN